MVLFPPSSSWYPACPIADDEMMMMMMIRRRIKAGWYCSPSSSWWSSGLRLPCLSQWREPWRPGARPELHQPHQLQLLLSLIVCYCPCHCLCEGKCSQTSLLFIKQVVLWNTLLFISLSSSCCAKTSSSARLKFVIANILRKKYVKKKNTGAAN